MIESQENGPLADGGAAAGGLVLVVERDPHVRELEAHFLRGAGYDVEFAGDGVTALALALKRAPAIVITEIMLPRLDGLALCRAIKRDARLNGTAVLIFSILAAHGRAREAGADGFLIKPLVEHRLVTCVRELLRDRPLPPSHAYSTGRPELS